MMLGWLQFLGVRFGLDDFLKFEFTVGDDGQVLGLEVPNLPSDFGTDGDPVAFRVEGQSGDGSFSVMDRLWFFNIAEVENSNFQIFATSDDEVSSGRNSQSINIGVVSLERVLNAEGLVVPDF